MGEPKYLGAWGVKDWRGSIGLDSMLSDFEIDSVGDFNVLVARYDQEDYEGSAFVLLEKEGQLYEVYASHCSCFGLEYQFEPKPVSIDDLKANLERGYQFDGCEKEVRDILESLA